MGADKLGSGTMLEMEKNTTEVHSVLKMVCMRVRARSRENSIKIRKAWHDVTGQKLERTSKQIGF